MNRTSYDSEKDWRLDAYDHMIDYAEKLRALPSERLPYFRTWIEHTAKVMRLFPQGDYLAREFERMNEHKLQIQELERNDISNFDFRMEFNLVYMMETRKKLIDLLRSHEHGVERAGSVEHDIFLSYVHEDDDGLIGQLVHKLRWLNLAVWYDDTDLRLGDGVRKSIDNGVRKATFGVLVITPNYLTRQWSQYELDGLVAREIGEGRIILPVWHGVSRDDVLVCSPALADRVALDSSKKSVAEIAFQVAEQVASNG